MTTAELACDCAARGMRIFQLRRDGSRPKAWPERASSDPEMVEAWYRGVADLNYGVATGDGVLVLDLDHKDGKDASARIRQSGIELPKSHLVRTPSGGWHVYMRIAADAGVTIGTDLFGDASGVDWRCDRGYVVGAGSTRDDGTYERVGGWQGALPDAPADLVELLTRGKRSDSIFSLPEAIDDRPLIPAGEQESSIHERAFNIARITPRPSVNEGTAMLWQFVVDRCPNAPGREPWTVEHARQKIERAYAVEIESPINVERDRPSELFEVLDIEAMRLLEPAQMLQPHVVLGVNMLVGEPGSLKTFKALAMAAHATGDTIYVCREGIGSLAKRLDAYGAAAGCTVDHVRFITADVQLPADAGRLVESIRPFAPQLVIVDTLTDTSAALDENSSDMRQVYNAMRTVQVEYACAVVLLVHTGWDGKRERGHSSIRGMADLTMLMQRADNGVAKLSCLKARDHEPFDPAYYQLEREPEREPGIFGDGQYRNAWLVDATRDDYESTDDTAAGSWVALLYQAFADSTFTVNSINGKGIGAHSTWSRSAPPGRLWKLRDLGHVVRDPDGRWRLTQQGLDHAREAVRAP